MGLPHSEIFGSKIAPISPKLIAGCHVLHRLSVPRHPPNALNALEIRPMRRDKPSTHTSQGVQPRNLGTVTQHLCRSTRNISSPTAARMIAHPHNAKEQQAPSPTGAVTHLFNLFTMSNNLHRIKKSSKSRAYRCDVLPSYDPKRPSLNPKAPQKMVEPDGIEPTT